MKIISKYKDYYDWVVGKYGMDEKMVLDRRKDYYPKVREFETKNNINGYTLAICGELFYVVFYKGKSYHTKEELHELNEYLYKHHKDKILFQRAERWYKTYWTNGTWDTFIMNKSGKTDVNTKYGIPTLIKTGEDSWQGVLLKEFGVGNYITAEEMFEKVYSWISAQKDVTIENNQTDKEKILSHGLDYIKSFRHRK